MNDLQCEWPHCRQIVSPGAGMTYYNRRLCNKCWAKLCTLSIPKVHEILKIRPEKVRERWTKEVQKICRMPVTITRIPVTKEEAVGIMEVEGETS